MEKLNLKRSIIGILLLVSVLGASYWLISRTGWLEFLMDGTALHAKVVQLGVWGPLAIITLMAGAIMWSPIPSAPIAMAAVPILLKVGSLPTKVSLPAKKS